MRLNNFPVLEYHPTFKSLYGAPRASVRSLAVIHPVSQSHRAIKMGFCNLTFVRSDVIITFIIFSNDVVEQSVSPFNWLHHDLLLELG